MIPSKTHEWFQEHGRGHARRFSEIDLHVITGVDMTDLAALADRLNGRIIDGDELRDWQNRINLILMSANSVEDLLGRKETRHET